MPENDSKALLALALFRIDPRSQECRELIHQSLVEITLLDSDGSLTADNIHQGIVDILEQPLGISKEECKAAIKECIKQDRIKGKQAKYSLRQERKSILLEQRATSISDELQFNDSLIQCVENELNISLDAIARTLLCTAVKNVIQKIFHEKSVELESLLADKKCDYKSLLSAGSAYNPIEALKNEIKPVVSIYAPNRGNEVISAIQLFISAINKAALRYIISLHHRVFYYQLLNIDPGLIELQKRCFENIKLYLDTNVVISYLFEAHPLHTIVRDILAACKVLRINLIISTMTCNEVSNKILQSNQLITRIGDTRAQSLIANTVEGRRAEPIIATFVIKKQVQKNLRWGGFIGPYDDLETTLLDQDVVLAPEGCGDVKTHPQYNRVWQTVRMVRASWVSDNIIDHDASNFILIHSLREQYPDNPLLGPSIWLLTLDNSLKEDERRLASVFNTEHCRLVEEWGEILLPFQNLGQFVFKDYISYLIASEFGALMQVQTLDLSILEIICNPEFLLDDFFDYPVELQIKVLSGMQKDRSVRELREQAAKAVTTEDKIQLGDSLRMKELQLLAQEKERVEERVAKLSEEITQLRSELTRVLGSAKDKTEIADKLEEKLHQAEKSLSEYEGMSLWGWLRSHFTRR